MQFRKPFFYALLIAMGCLILLLLVYVSLPRLLTVQAGKYLGRTAGLETVQFKIKKLSLVNAFFSDIRINPGVYIGGIDIDYRLFAKAAPDIQQIVVSGLMLQASLDDNHRFQIHGIDWPAPSGKKRTAFPESVLPILPDKLILQHARLLLTIKGRPVEIDIDASAVLDSTDGTITAQAEISVLGQPLSCSLSGNLHTGIQTMQLTAGKIDPAVVSRFGLRLPDDMIIGPFQANAHLEDDLLYIEGAGSVSQKQEVPVGFDYAAKMALTGDDGVEIRMNTQAPATFNIPVDGRTIRLAIPRVDISGELRQDQNRQPVIQAQVQAAGARMATSDKKWTARGIDMNLAWQYPATQKRDAGTYAVAAISHAGGFDFSTKGNVIQAADRMFLIKGDLNCRQVPDAAVRFSAHLDLKNQVEGSLEFALDPVLLTHKTVMKHLPKNLQTARFDARVSARGKAVVDNRQVSSSMRMDLEAATLSLPDAKLTAKGIRSSIEFSDLLAFQTIPGQNVTVDAITLNTVQISDAKARFSIEKGPALLVENIRFQWCNGQVTTEAIRFPQASERYELSLYCDRLEMAQLLEQMGAFSAEGNGSLNGRIPVVYQEGDISFDNGFLFSTPGSGGKIRIQNTELLTAGLPMDSPQFSQMDLAREALKNFDYQWAKLVFNTVDDTLLVNMEMDGKPSGVLPFEYKTDVGRFVRVDASSPGSNFQGIKLDVNLNLPFNDVIKFGNKLNTILQQ